ncbi:MAG TPA: AAA family ATPase [Candidatus Krumholzibacteria bacterium]|nr:AAA family ATPase [Candidatus Krumholzibacteria bacterium]HPD72979.1 AAA family ATPase [Candidatus Krumholzibacteria bacterium]HRY41778.1 AAA family ATPase [Candidatus Krumholzibacteria bacterium]
MKEKQSTPLRFASIRVENWKNFAAAKVDLQQRGFLVGPNAAGKSNFLDVFRFLRDLATSGGGFQEAVTRRGGVSVLRCLAARQYSDIVVHATVKETADDQSWQYELVFNQDNRRRPVVKRERVLRGNRIVLDRPNEADKKDPERLTQTYLEQVNVNRDFRELGHFFASVRYLHVVPQLVREPDRSVGRVQDPFGGDFLEQIAKTPERTRSARLRRVVGALSVAVPQLTQVELWRDPRGTPHLRGKYDHWRPQGAWQTEEQFSDGTLRLMGLLWAAMEGGGPLLLEEPELSLHSEVVRYLPQMFARLARRSGRQIILSTHSSELIQDEGIGLNEVLLFLPDREGTRVRTASDFEDIPRLLEGGVTLSEAVMPKTRPDRAEQLLLFGDR